MPLLLIVPAVVGRMATTTKKNETVQSDSERGALTSSSSTTLITSSQSPVTQGPTDRVETRSAFEITSVEGEENELGAVPTSKDADELKNALNRSDRDHNRLSTSSNDSTDHTATSNKVLHNNIDHMTGETHLSNPSPLPKPLDSNGPLLGGPSRFRRVNVYPRGRWSVRDTYEPEERPESETKSLSLVNVIDMGNNSPLQLRKNQAPPSSLATSDYSCEGNRLHSRSNSEASFVTDSAHLPNPPRDTGTLSDKSSVMADVNPSLSRTESNSSLATKSLDDEPDREPPSRDLDLESITSMPNTHTPDSHLAPSSHNSIERPSPLRQCVMCSRRNMQELSPEDQRHTVEITIDLLKEQLSQLLHLNTSYQSLLKEKEDLQKENNKLKERIKELEVATNTNSNNSNVNSTSGDSSNCIKDETTANHSIHH